MIHFPSSLQHAGTVPRRTDSLNLNATQQKLPSHQIFLTVEEELHDARRVHSHGQEEDLRLALNMLIDRLSQLSTQLSDAYKTNAELEVQLNVAKSNLQLVISNNEMLEDALKRDSSGYAAQNVGWRRSSARTQSTDDVGLHQQQQQQQHHPTSSGEYTPTLDSPAQESSRFFRFRFTGSSPNPSNSSASSSRPGTPHDGRSPAIPGVGTLQHLNSPSLPVLPSHPSKEKEQLEELERELEKEKEQRKAAKEEKEALEAELESLSQALFEEANKMVASERIRRADIEDELKEAKLEKEALRSALRLLEGENENLRLSSSGSESGSTANSPFVPPSNVPTTSTSTSAPIVPRTITVTKTGAGADVPVVNLSSASPITQHLPPSLSSLPTRLPPPPEPLGIPTTPFDYDATFGGMDTATPRRTVRPLEEEEESLSAPAPAEADGGKGQGKGDTDEGEEPEDRKAEDVVPQKEDTKAEERREAEEAEKVKEKEEKEKTIPELGMTQHKPPSLRFLPHEHDPWADAPSATTARVGAVMSLGDAV
ncbi:hypothetical protein D9615_008508 [Tricholomella constricta]|uniref:GDP/GTP exchange factor Sec2 N-terminal domain-containing protein n=1 Tax=Tricholomella constricta TaxID=117010 RepID=A0A8H5LZZ0_9AGAR|nr:hypothetical protein D9615_008508 [Tricholomella constricta]